VLRKDSETTDARIPLTATPASSAYITAGGGACVASNVVACTTALAAKPALATTKAILSSFVSMFPRWFELSARRPLRRSQLRPGS